MGSGTCDYYHQLRCLSVVSLVLPAWTRARDLRAVRKYCTAVKGKDLSRCCYGSRSAVCVRADQPWWWVIWTWACLRVLLLQLQLARGQEMGPPQAARDCFVVESGFLKGTEGNHVFLHCCDLLLIKSLVLTSVRLMVTRRWPPIYPFIDIWLRTHLTVADVLPRGT